MDRLTPSSKVEVLLSLRHTITSWVETPPQLVVCASYINMVSVICECKEPGGVMAKPGTGEPDHVVPPLPLLFI